ncbi:hypothetical protein Tco_0879036 [Tanacetum coccineum]
MMTLEGFPFVIVNTKEYHSECSGKYHNDIARHLNIEGRGLKCYFQQTPFDIEVRGLNDVPVLKRVPALTLRACLLSHWLGISAFEPFGGSLSTFVVLEANVFPVGTHLRQTVLRILPVGCHLRQDLGLVVFSCTVLSLTARYKNNMVTNYNRGGGNVTSNVTTMHVQNNTPMPNRPFKKLTQQELEDKRAKHLCFNCDQKYTPGHKCSGQLYSLEVIGDGLDVGEDEEMQLTKEGVMSTYTTSLLDEPPLISLNALTDENSYRTMRVRAYVRKNVVAYIGFTVKYTIF